MHNIKKIFYQGKYISDSLEIIEKIENVFCKRGKFLIKALTGAGKTYLVSYLFKKLSKKYKDRIFIIACPNRVQNIQNQNQEEYELVALVGGVEVNKILIPRLSMVYDKAEDVIEALQTSLKGKEITLVIDEAHHLVYGKNYREKPVKDLLELENYCYNSIHITATERACKLCYEYKEIIELTPKDKVISIRNLNIIQGKRDKLEIKFLEKIKNLVKNKTKVLVFLDNIEKINQLVDYYSKNVLKDYNVKILDSEKKNTDLFRYITDNSQIPNDVDIVFCTSVLECGTNIKNNNIVTLYYQNNNSFLNIDKILQALARCREKQEEAYIFLSKPSKKESDDCVKEYKTIDNIYNSLKNEMSLKALDFTDIFINAYEKQHIDFNSFVEQVLKLKDIYDKNIGSCLYWNKDNIQVEVDNEILTSLALRRHDIQLINNTNLLINILEEGAKAQNISYFDIDMLEQNEKVKKEAKNQKEESLKNKKELKEQREELIKEIKSNLQESSISLLETYLIENTQAKQELSSILPNDLKNTIDKLENEENKFILEEIEEEALKSYQDRKKYKDSSKNVVYLTFKERLETINKKDDRKLILYKKFNKLDMFNQNELELLGKYKSEYAIIRNYMDKKIGNRLTNNLLLNLYWELNPKKKEQKKEPNQKTLDRLKKTIKALYIISKDNRISSLNK